MPAKGWKKPNPQTKEEKLAYQRKWRQEKSSREPGYIMRARHLANAKDPEKAKLARRKGTLRAYKLTPAEFDALVEAQGGVCKICKRPPRGKWTMLAIDHCHTGGQVRGLLCHQCNLGIGMLQDSPERCRLLATYLYDRR